jgi:hypothetical protein
MSLESMLEKKQEEYSRNAIERVRTLIEYRKEHPHYTPYSRIFEDVLDFKLYFELHEEWEGKSTSDMHMDAGPEARAFYFSFLSWTRRKARTEKGRKRLMQTIFKPRHNIYSHLKTIDDWLEEFSRHKWWDGYSTRDMCKHIRSGANAFYQAFTVWTQRKAKTEKKRKKLVQAIFRPRHADYSGLKTIDDWRREFSRHEEWKDYSTSDMQLDVKSGASKFYLQFYRWKKKDKSRSEYSLRK